MKYLILAILTFPAFSQVQVHLADPNYNKKEFSEGYRVTTEEVKSPRLPSKHERDALLEGRKEFKDWDELDKDIFVMNLKNKSLINLQKTYPKVPIKLLKELKDKIEK